jgi:hypothetical protein
VRLVRLTTWASGRPIWVNPDKVLYVRAIHDTPDASYVGIQDLEDSMEIEGDPEDVAAMLCFPGAGVTPAPLAWTSEPPS